MNTCVMCKKGINYSSNGLCESCIDSLGMPLTYNPALNPALCGSVLLTDSQDVTASCELIGINPESITAVIECHNEAGDLITWFGSESRRPFDANINYRSRAYYLDTF